MVSRALFGDRAADITQIVQRGLAPLPFEQPQEAAGTRTEETKECTSHDGHHSEAWDVQTRVGGRQAVPLSLREQPLCMGGNAQ